MTLFEAVRRHARDAPHSIAVIDAIAPFRRQSDDAPPESLSYSELCEGAERLAALLADLMAASPDGAWNAWQEGKASHPPVLATWMRRGTGWYLVFCAATRLQIPLVALSMDLTDRVVESTRNAQMVEEHRPSLVIVDRAWDDEAFNIHDFYKLWAQVQQYAAGAQSLRASVGTPDMDATLCFNYTGGTTKASRCARITHRMALHEIAAYPKIAHLGREDRVLQQHSLYWGASAYGEIDIALAFGCTLVFCEAWDTDTIVSAIQDNIITCAGLVPSVLAALEPADVPSLRLVFTWGEALQARVACDWARRVHLVDLLISTECWLSLCGDWSAHVRKGSGSAEMAPPPFKAVPGAVVRLRPMGSRPVAQVGELLVSGPMVSPGYSDEMLNADAFETDAGGVRWYCTKDCLQPSGECGFTFAGRADDLVKVGGAWVDTRELERKILLLDGVAEVCICSRDVFVVLESLWVGTVHTVRKALPPDFVPYVVTELPRNPGTGKVDRKVLAEIIGDAQMPELQDAETTRCMTELSSIRRWGQPLLLLLLVASTLRALSNGSWVPVTDTGFKDSLLHVCTLMFAFIFRAVVEFVLRILSLVYLTLGAWYLPDRITGWVRYFPGGQYGIVLVLSIAPTSASWGIMLALPGILLAAYRGRLLSWPLVALFGFPFWLRGVSVWMWDYGRAGTLKWYMYKVRSLVVVVPNACAEFWMHAMCRFGCARACEWCKAVVPSSSGKRDKPSVDKPSIWYCNRCWLHFENHKQCGKCKEWIVKDKMSSTGPDSWHCLECVAVLAPKSNLPTNGPEQNKGAPKGKMGLTQKFRTIKLLEEAAYMPTNDLKRQAVLDDGMENSTAQRRRTMDATANGVVEQACDGRGQSPEKLLVPHRRKNESPSPTLAPAKRTRLDNEVCQTAEELALPATPKSKEWKIIERATGLVFESLSESLLSLDSLHITKMASALRRQAGKRLSREVLKRSASLGELLVEIERLPDEQLSSESMGGCEHHKKEYAIWGMMWRSKCQWQFHRSRPLSLATLRIALKMLMERHVSLRAELRDPYPMFVATQQALTVFELFRRYGARFFGRSVAGRSAFNFVSGAGCLSFLKSWPRIAAKPMNSVKPESLPLRVFDRVATAEQARNQAWSVSCFFRPPFSAIYVPYGKDADEGAIVHLSVAHMLSDGYCVLPIMDDLAHFVARAEQPTDNNGSMTRSQLPPVPTVFAALEARIVRTVTSDCKAYVDHGITREFFGKRIWHEAGTTYATLPHDVVTAIRHCATRLSVPDDIALLAIIGIALAWLTHNHTQVIAMIVPQRDGASENDMVGLFADLRHLTIGTKGLNYAGMALRLHHDVKERRWHAPGIATQFDVPMVNFEWTDFEEREGFAQNVRPVEDGESTLHPVRIAVDQPDSDSWRMRATFAKATYSEGRRRKFVDLFEKSLQGMLWRPLDPIWCWESW